MVKLAIVTWNYNDFQGISRCVTELIARAQTRYEIHLFTTSIDHPVPQGVTVHRINLSMRRYFYLAEWEFFIRVGRRIQRGRFDLVHLHFPAWVPASLFSCHGVAPVALRSLRSFPKEARRDVPLYKMLKFYLQIPLHSYHLRNPKTIVMAVSDKVRSEIRAHYGRPADTVMVIPNGVDLETFHPDLVPRWCKTMRERMGLGKDRFVLLFVGHRFRNKGARYAVETVARLPERAVLVIVGDDRPESIRDPRGELSPLVRSGRVLFAGFERDIRRYYAAADALIFPSYYESFGLVVLEAMAVGLPVVTARTVGMGCDIIRDGENGFVVDRPWDVEGMAERVRLLMEDPKLAQRIGARARKVAESYSWDRYAAQTLSVYERMCEEGMEYRDLERIS